MNRRGAKSWRRFWEKAPRQLQFTRAGRFLVGIALLTGFAAINTGNNLLFLGWGLVLSGIALSGVLSEGVLRSVRLDLLAPAVGRVGESLHLPLHVHNRSERLPAFALESFVTCMRGDEETLAWAPYLLRLSPLESRQAVARFVPSQRGVYVAACVTAKTAYPFGFFEKSRRFTPPLPSRFLVGPLRMDVESWAKELLVRLGEGQAARAGYGDEFFGLKSFRTGDDPRRIHWRRSLATGRVVAREHALQQGRELLLEVVVARAAQSPDVATERTLSFACSLAEALLARGLRVGILAPGVWVAPESGSAQALRCVQAFAELDATQAVPRFAHRRVGRLMVATVGLPLPASDLAVRVGATSLELCERGAA